MAAVFVRGYRSSWDVQLKVGTAEMITDIEFTVKQKPSSDELAAFYVRQHYETTQSREKIQKMLQNTFCMVTARRGGEMVGFARGVTDGLWGRLAECKLDPALQGPGCVTKKDGRIEHDTQGIAREMAVRVIDALWEYGVERIDAIAYGTEVDFCEDLGFKKIRGVEVMELCSDAPAASAAASSSRAGSVTSS